MSGIFGTNDGFVYKRRRGRSKIDTPVEHIATVDQLKKKNKKRKKMILMESEVIVIMDSALQKSQIFSDDSVCQNLFIDELLLQIILNLSNLCDGAEPMIMLDKEQFKQSMMDIPLLGSPRSIFVSLSD
ncbi:hypothetical protein MKX01_001520 [Papaver californicum]|nr:hypothetical protein MKX01_001520 [Papaver californicum]